MLEIGMICFCIVIGIYAFAFCDRRTTNGNVIKIVFLMILLPSVVEASTVIPTQMTPKFSYSNFESREFVFQDSQNMNILIGPFSGGGIKPFEFFQAGIAEFLRGVSKPISSIIEASKISSDSKDYESTSDLNAILNDDGEGFTHRYLVGFIIGFIVSFVLFLNAHQR